MWGAKIYQNRHAILRASYNIFYEIEHKIEYGFDQKMLDTFIWPLTINNSVRNSMSRVIISSSFHQAIPLLNSFVFQTMIDSVGARQLLLRTIQRDHRLPQSAPRH